MTRLHKVAEPSQPVFLTRDTLLARYDGRSRMWLHRRIKRFESLRPLQDFHVRPGDIGNRSYLRHG